MRFAKCGGLDWWLKRVSLATTNEGPREEAGGLRRRLQPPPDREIEGPSLDLGCRQRELPGCGDSLGPEKEIQGVALLTTALGEEQTGGRWEAILGHLLSVKRVSLQGNKSVRPESP